MGSNGVTTRDYQPRNRQVSCHTGLAAIMTKGMYIMVVPLLSQCLSGCFAACDYVIYLYSGMGVNRITFGGAIHFMGPDSPFGDYQPKIW